MIHKANIKWTLEAALKLIREAQPLAMQSGFYLALAGGVLNNGFSDNDLDLVAVNRTRADDGYALKKTLECLWGPCDEALINNRLYLSWPSIDLVVIEHELHSRY